MTVDLQHVIDHLNADHGSDKITGLVVLATYRGNKIRMMYTDHIEVHPAPVIGYLQALCHDLIQLVRR